MPARIQLLGLAVAAGIAWTVMSAAAQTERRAPLVIDSMVGSDLFRFYCASCHGADGRGSGPLAQALRTPPADLTSIARRHRGTFPRSQVTAYVSGEQPDVVAHGPRTMPVWGPIFRALDTSDVRTTMRIDNLVSYIESIQKK
jgi:mono/diheme cytochrome c family protein